MLRYSMGVSLAAIGLLAITLFLANSVYLFAHASGF